MKKSQKKCQFGSRKWFWLSIIEQFAGGWYKAQQSCAPTEKSVINTISLLMGISDWPIIMIGPSGLLLVLFAVPVSVLLVGLQKSK
jgi:hypothetical protein